MTSLDVVGGNHLWIHNVMINDPFKKLCYSRFGGQLDIGGSDDRRWAGDFQLFEYRVWVSNDLA